MAFRCSTRFDVGARLGELDRLSVRAPPVDVALAGVVGREHELLAAVLVEEILQIPRAVADVDLRVVEVVGVERAAVRANRDPSAVAGVICISPIAPDDDFASLRNFDSW